MVPLIVLFIINVGTARPSSNDWFGRANSEAWKDVNDLYLNVKADMKSKGKAGHHIGKAESDQLMVHNIKGILKAQKYSIHEAANNFNVSESFLSKIMETEPFNKDDMNISENDISNFGFKDQTKRFDEENSSKRYAVFNISSFDCPDCTERTITTVSNVKGTPTDSPMMEFTCQGLTVKNPGFYAVLPIGDRNKDMLPVYVFGPAVNRLLLGVVSMVWLNKGDAITFKISTHGIKYLVGFQLRVHKL